MTGWVILCEACGGRVTVAIDGGDEGKPSECPHCGRSFTWTEGVLVLGQTHTANDYPEDIDEILVAVEPRHFWFSARNELLLATMRELLGPIEGRRVVDIGCGTGFVLAALQRAGALTCGVDMHMSVLGHARSRTGALLVCHDAASVPLARQFDIAMLCDVIEHAQDDAGVLHAAAATVVPGGAVVVTVPANPALWSPLDEVYGHKRRYTHRMLTAALQRAGLTVVAVRRFNALLYPPQLIQRHALRRLSASADRAEILRRGLQPPPAPVDAVLRVVSRLEIPLSRLSPPFGTSLVAVARVR